MTNTEKAQHIDALLTAGMDLRTLMATAHDRSNRLLHAAEIAKDHPLLKVQMSDVEFEAFCQHLTDGGGVHSDTADLEELPQTSLLHKTLQALHDRNQPELLRLMVCVFKSWMKQRGVIVPAQGAVHIVGGESMEYRLANMAKRNEETK